MRTSHPRAILLAGLALLLCPRAASAQGARLHLQRLDTSHAPAIRAYVSFVTDEGGIAAGKLAEDFRLQEESGEPSVTAGKLDLFSHAGEPAHVVAVVQLSPSMAEAVAPLRQGLREVAQALAQVPGSTLSIVGYGTSTRALLTRSGPAEALFAIDRLAIDPEANEPHLLDAVGEAMGMLRERTARQIMIVFSDGHDANDTRDGFVDAGARAQQGRVVIDPVLFAPYGPGQHVHLLAKESSGTLRRCQTREEIAGRFSAIADEVRRQYVLTFQSGVEGDDAEHRLLVVYRVGSREIPSEVLVEKVPKLPRTSGPWPTIMWGGASAGALLLLALALRRWRRSRRQEPPPTERGVGGGIAPARVTIDQSVQDPVRPPPRVQPFTVVQPAGAAWITVLSGTGAGQVHSLKKEETVIGTDPACDIQVPDQYMSASHCRILRLPDGGFQINDLGSLNGILTDDGPVKERVLLDNAVFRLGTTRFQFKIASGGR